MREELLDIAFALQELGQARDLGQRAASTARRRLQARRDALHADLLTAYRSLPAGEAEPLLVDFLKATPDSAQAHLQRAEVHEQAGRSRQAADEYFLAAAFDPRSAMPALRLAQLHERARLMPEALYFYRALLATAPDSTEARTARDKVAALERQVRSEHTAPALPPVPQTVQGLEYLLATLQDMQGTLEWGDEGVPQLIPGDKGIAQLIERVAGQIRALQAPPAVTPPAPPAPSAEERERLRREAVHARWLMEEVQGWSQEPVLETVAARVQDALTARLHELEERIGPLEEAPARPERDEGYARYVLAQLDRFVAAGAMDQASYDTLRPAYLPRVPAPAGARPVPPRQPAAIAPAAPPKPPAPPPAPAAPREPFDWAAFWSALLSERTLTAILSFGVVLVALSSLFLLITFWPKFGELKLGWVVREAFLAAQFLAFLGIGYIVKERLGLRLSGLALISIAALWVPLTVGAGMFEVYTVPGNIKVPGLNLPLDLPVLGWLVITATCIPVWALLTYRFRGHLLMHGTILATGATLSLIGASLGLTWEWAVAGFGVYALPVLFIGRRVEGTDLRDIARPLFWTSQAVLVGVGAFLFVAWAQHRTGGSPLALVAVAGAGLALAAHRIRRDLAYEYAVAVLPSVALLFALSDGNVLPVRQHGAALAVLSVAYLVGARAMERRYAAGPAVLRVWAPLQPAYAIAYACAAAALLWPWSDDASRMGTLFVVAGVAAASAWWSGRWFWTALAGLLLSAAVLLALRQISPLPAVYGSAVLAVMAWAYLASLVAMGRAPAHAAVAFAGAQLLTAAAIIWPLRANDLTVLHLVLPVAAVTYLASAVLVHQGRDGSFAAALGYAAARFGVFSMERGWRLRGAVLFLAAGAVVLPVWTALLRADLAAPPIWTGLDFMALAVIYGAGAYWLRRAGLPVHAATLGAIAALLVVVAPFYHYDAAGITWALAGMLYADAALAALAGYALRRPALFAVASALLVVPFALTLDLSTLPPERWAVPWVLLAAGYFAGALALSRAPSAATPMLATSYALTALALAWTLGDPAGTMARLTLPVATGITGVSAFLAHQRRPASLRWLLERAVVSRGAPLTMERRAEIGAVCFGLLSAVLVPAWVALMLLWRGVDAMYQAFVLMGWAFIAATLAHLWLRRHSGLYALAFLVYGALLAFAATVTSADPAVGPMGLTIVLYADAALSVAYWRFLQSPRPLYLAGVLLPVAIGLTLDVAGVPPRLWSTPLMALAAAYLGLDLLLGRGSPASAPFRYLGLGLSLLALAWSASAFVGVTWMFYNSRVLEHAFIAATPLVAAGTYAVVAYSRSSRRYGHMASWALAGFLVMAVATAEAPFQYAGIPVAVAAMLLALPGLALHRAGAGASLDRVADAPTPPGWARAAMVFGLPLSLAGYGLAALALAMAAELQRVVGFSWPSEAVYLILVALLAASARVARAPWFAAGAALLFMAPFSLAVHEVFGPPGLPTLPDTALAFGWSALAVAYLAAGLVMERPAPRYSRAFPVLSYGLLLMAAVAGQHSAARLSLVYGVIVGVALASAYLTHRRRATSIVKLLAAGLSLDQGVVRRYVTLGLIAVGTLLSPLWLLEILALRVRTPEVQGLVLSVLAPAYVLVAAFMARRTDRLYSLPGYLCGFALTAIGPLLSARGYAFNVAALALATGTYALSAWVLRRSWWSHAAFALLTVLVPATVARALSWFDLLPEGYGLALMGVALAYLGVGTLGDRLAARAGASPRSLTLLPGSPWGHLDLPVGRTTALYVMGTLLTGVAAALAMPGWPRDSLFSAAVYVLGAAYFGLACARFRSALLLYPALALGIAGYTLVLGLLHLDPHYFGVGLLPGALVSVTAGWLLHRLGVRAGAGVRAGGLAWALPFLAVGYGTSVIAAALSGPFETPRLIALLALTAVSAGSLGVFRSWVWSYPLVASAQAAFASLVALSFLHLSQPVIGILYVPAAVAMLVCFAVATRGTAAGITALADRRGAPYVVAAALDMIASLALAATANWAGAVVSASYAVIFGAAAVVTRVRVLPYVSTAFATAAVIFTARQLALGWSQSAVAWSVQGLCMWWAGRVCDVLVRRRPGGRARPALEMWVAPLSNTSVRLSWFALAFVVAVVGPGLVEAGRFGAAQINDVSAVLAVLSLLYVGMAFHNRKGWMGYVAVGLLLLSWVMQLVDLEVRHAQLYAAPAGLYLLGIAFFERRRLRRGDYPVLLDLAAVLILLGSAFWQATVEEPAWAYSLLMGVEAVLLVLWGAGNQTKLPFIAGILGFVIDAVHLTTTLQLSVPLAGVILIIGLLLIVVVVGIEWKREELIWLGRRWTARLKEWDW